MFEWDIAVSEAITGYCGGNGRYNSRIQRHGTWPLTPIEPIPMGYASFYIPDEFVIGYGLGLRWLLWESSGNCRIEDRMICREK